jgi:hypothetical protein
MRARLGFVALARVFAMCSLLFAAAVSARPQFEDTVEDYTVVAGDTIADITRRLLGDEIWWEDNWRLNPQVRDPDLLRIGQRLRIITQRRVIAERAEVVQAVNRTEKMLERPRWQPAAAGDTLGGGQGLRTRESSTAELRFNAESTLRLDEFSQVFLAAKETSLRGVDRGSIQIERGSVDLVFAPIETPRTEIELIAGPSSTRPAPSAGRATEVRTGATEDGGARVMVYSGRSQVSAGGAEVAVEQGMGTRVPEQGPPTPPEPLLPAPTPELAEQRWNHSNGRLRWAEVAGAAAYQVQVCADAACTQRLQSARVEAPARFLQVSPLPVGAHHWQVRALSANGLEGYLSPMARVQVDNAAPDLEPPMLALQPLDGFVQGADGATRHGPAARWLPVAHDEASGVERIELRRGDGAWQAWDGKPLEMEAVRSAVTRLRAVDRLDQVSPELRLEVRETP